MKCLSSNGKPILVFNKCCCFSLRTGVLIIASVEIIFEILVLVLHIVLGSLFSHELPDPEETEITDRTSSSDHPTVEKIPSGVSSTFIDHTLRLFLHETVAIIVTCILIYGVKKNRIGLMKIWMWVRAINLLDDMIDEVSITERFVTFLSMCFLVFPLSVAAILVVRSYIIQLTSNENFVQLEEVPEEA